MITGLALRVVTAVAGLFGFKLSEFAAGAIAALIMVAGIAGGVGFIAYKAYSYGVEKTEARWKAKALQSKIDALEADLSAARGAAVNASVKATAIKEQAEKDRQEDAKYIEELEGRPVGACRLTDDDLRGMRATRANPVSPRSRPAAKAKRGLAGRAGAAARKGR